MDKNTRYSVPRDEGFEPDSHNEVLVNLLGIKNRDEMELAEEKELSRTGKEIVNLYADNHQFSASDLCDIHELWLSDIYPFAGKYRTVSMSKDGFPFAAPNLINKLMLEFEEKYLKKYTPCHEKEETLAMQLGIVHVELIVIHPFREGNGRLARLLANLMAIQSKLFALNYEIIDRVENPDGFNRYIQAIQNGFMGDYESIRQIFLEIIKSSY